MLTRLSLVLTLLIGLAGCCTPPAVPAQCPKTPEPPAELMKQPPTHYLIIPS